MPAAENAAPDAHVWKLHHPAGDPPWVVGPGNQLAGGNSTHRTGNGRRWISIGATAPPPAFNKNQLAGGGTFLCNLRTGRSIIGE